ncbi:phospholipid carrier-dependent glycosyltransferase [Kordia sp.]|uniref:phospholipid carrier-dependent glycosyltransferase n=1 Tax=Kordia sp. TaxID=1965332 RepID=UPI003B5CF413
MIKNSISNPRFVSIIYILILTLAFLKIYTSIFDEKVSLVGDNVSYYILGNAIADGEGYTNIHHKEKEAHYHYPPGYPMLIAAVSNVFSNNIITIKRCNGVLLFGAILLLFFIVKKLAENDHIAFATSILTILNYHILGFSTIMMSEIPFLFFSLLCLWIFLNINYSKPVFKNWLFLLLIICVSFSFYIRSVGLALIVSFAAFLCLKKHWQYLFSLLGGFVILYLPWMIRNRESSGNTYISQLLLKNPYQPELGQVDFLGLFERVFLNIERYIAKEIPSSVVFSGDITYTNTFSVTAFLLGFSIIAVIIFGIFRLKKYRTFIFLYILTFFALLMLWPSVWYGTRFLLPVIPLLIFLIVYAIAELLKALSDQVITKQKKYLISVLTIIIFGSWIFIYGTGSISSLKEKAEGVYNSNYKNYFAIAEWIRDNTDENSVTSVRKEGIFYLFSKKKVTNYLRTLDEEAQIEYLKSKNVTHVVVDQLGYSSTSKYLLPAIDRYPNKFKTIKELKNPNTYLMKFEPTLGYWGDWKNNKRNGFGTYVWEDGQKYEGFWKDDVRHGKGTVFFNSGESLSGVWENGKLNGEVVKKDKNGVVTEKSIYKNNIKIQVIKEADKT